MRHLRNNILSTRTLVLLLMVGFIGGCATVEKKRSSSDYLLATNKSTKSVVAAVKQEMLKNKYNVVKENLNAGLIVFAPRVFQVDKKGKKIAVQQFLQARHEGASAKLHISYKCNYSGDGEKFVDCLQNDKPVSARIERIEAVLVEGIKTALANYVEPTNSTEFDAGEKDSGK